MRNKRKTIWILGIGILSAAFMGCGDVKSSAAAPKNSEETVSKGHTSPDRAEDKEPMEQDEPEDNTQKETDLLCGSVKSIEADAIIISQSFEEGDVIVQPAEGSPDEVLVTVCISEETQYEVKTVKNGGENGDADVEIRTGSISDLKEQASVDISGYSKDEKFMAEKIIIYEFI